MEYNVFVQWHENTSNFKRFAGGLVQINKDTLKTVEAANQRLVEHLWRTHDKYLIGVGGLYDVNAEEYVVANAAHAEPLLVDFGDGTIYVAAAEETLPMTASPQFAQAATLRRYLIGLFEASPIDCSTLPKFDTTPRADGKPNIIVEFTIPVESTGALAPMFASITLEVRARYEEEEKRTYAQLVYSYKHSAGGGNGYSVSLIVAENQVFTRDKYIEHLRAEVSRGVQR